ncbi:MAG: class IV adenylate cyclase [Anaerolineaceae bacterium]
MEQEIEIKFLLSDPAGYRQKLIASAARLVDDRVFELNLRFDTPERLLSVTGQVLRLRKDSRNRLTYKNNSHLEAGVLVRTEIETEVADFVAMKHLLESLGYEVFSSYEKYRETFWLDDVTVSIDEMPYGTFTELEGPSAEAIHTLADKLGLRWQAGIPSSYMLMLTQLNEKLKLGITDLTFETFETLHITPEDLGVEPAD